MRRQGDFIFDGDRKHSIIVRDTDLNGQSTTLSIKRGMARQKMLYVWALQPDDTVILLAEASMKTISEIFRDNERSL